MTTSTAADAVTRSGAGPRPTAPRDLREIWRTWWPELCIGFVAVLVRLLRLADRAPWNDENRTLDYVVQPIRAMYDAVLLGDSHPPLDALLRRPIYLLVGEDPFWLRLPSVLYGVATIGVVYVLGKRVGGRSVGLAAAAFLAVAPAHVLASQEIRMYALFGLLASIMMLLTVRLADPDEEVEPATLWVAFVAVGAALVLTHNLGGLALVAGSVTIAIVGRGRRRRQLLVTAGVTALVLSPWIPGFIRQVNNAMGGLGWLEDVSPHLLIGISRQAWSEFIRSGVEIEPAWAEVLATGSWTYGWFDAIVIIVALVGLAHLGRPALVAVLAFALVIPVFDGAVFLTGRNIFVDRTWLWVPIALSIPLGAGIVHLAKTHRRFAAVAVGAFVLVNTVALADYTLNYHGRLPL